MRFTNEEEVYVTMIVVKRPVGVGDPSLDPGRWTQSILSDLRNSRQRPEYAWPQTAGRMPEPAERPHPPRWGYFALSMVCFLTAGVLLYWVF